MLSGGSKLTSIGCERMADCVGCWARSGFRMHHGGGLGALCRQAGAPRGARREGRQGAANYEALAKVQERAFGLLGRKRRKVATIDRRSEVYSCKRWSYTCTIETGTCWSWGCGKAVDTSTVTGSDRASREVLWDRGDSGFYDLVRICDARGVEIVAEQRENLMKVVQRIRESEWKAFEGKQLENDGQSRRRRRKRANVKRKVKLAGTRRRRSRGSRRWRR